MTAARTAGKEQDLRSRWRCTENELAEAKAQEEGTRRRLAA